MSDGRRAAVVAAAWVGLTFTLGFLGRESLATDSLSEGILMGELEATAEGYARWGIVNSTHYPNGSWYLLYPFYRAGLDVHALRLVPLAIAALSVGLLAYAVLRTRPSPLAYLWTTLVLAVFVMQPGVRFWMGALHEHSLGTSLVLIAIALGIIGCGPVAYFLLGFVASWIGYDFLPTLVVTLFFSVLLLGAASISRHAVWTATVAVVGCGGGIAAGMLLHLVQLWLAYASFVTALRDLFAAAAVRAALVPGVTMNPEFAYVVGQPIDLKARFAQRHLWRFLVSPWLPKWTDPVAVGATLALAAVLFLVWPAPRRRIVGILERIAALVSAVAIAVFAVLAWPIVMPRHAVNHLHFVPRHALPVFLLLSLLPIRHWRTATRAVRESAPLWSVVKYLQPILVLASLAAVALWAIDWRDSDAMSFARVYATSSAAQNSMLYAPVRKNINVSSGGPGDWYDYWFSGVAPPRPVVFGVALPGRTVLRSVALRFWDRRFKGGQFTPTRYRLEGITGTDARTIAVFPPDDPGRDAPSSLSLGGFLFHRWTFHDPVTADAVQITVDDVGGDFAKDGGVLIASFEVGGDVAGDPADLWYSFPMNAGVRLLWAPVHARWRHACGVNDRARKGVAVAMQAVEERDVGGRIFERALTVRGRGRLELDVPLGVRTLAFSTAIEAAPHLTLSTPDGTSIPLETHPVWPLGRPGPLADAKLDMRFTAAVGDARRVVFVSDAPQDTYAFDVAVQTRAEMP